jgi:hypothetical protein
MEENNTTTRVREFLNIYFANYAWFETVTGVSASKWRDLDRGRTKAVTAEMIDALCRCWPEFAYWFVTGNEVSTRGQTTPVGYFGLEYGKVGSLVPNNCKFSRDANGRLQPDLGNTSIKDKLSKEYELSVAKRILYFSALANEMDSNDLAEPFWEEFIRPLENGHNFEMSDDELKNWINQFPIRTKFTEEEMAAKPTRFLAQPK